MICPVCCDSRVKKTINYKDWTIYKCSGCQFRFAHGGERLVIDEHYDEEYFQPMLARDSLKKWENIYRDKLLTAKKYSPNNKLLEVGSGASTFACAAAKDDFDVTIVDGSPDAVKMLTRCDGVDGWVDDLNNCTFPENKYGVLHSSHVIEHLHQPAEFLHECYRSLVEGGVLLLSFPAYEAGIISIRDNLYKLGIANHTYNYMAPDHVSYFSAKCIEKLLLNTGFEILELRRTKYISLKDTLNSMNKKSVFRQAVSDISNVFDFITDRIGYHRDLSIVARKPV